MPHVPHPVQAPVPVRAIVAQVREEDALAVPVPPARRIGIGESDPAIPIIAGTDLEKGFAHPGAGAFHEAVGLREEFGHLFFSPGLVQPTDCRPHLPGAGLGPLPDVLPVGRVLVTAAENLVGLNDVVHLELENLVDLEDEAAAEVDRPGLRPRFLFPEESLRRLDPLGVGELLEEVADDPEHLGRERHELPHRHAEHVL